VSDPASDFAHMWEWFATHCHGYSPLYERISAAVASDPELLAGLQAVPPSGQLPPALLAAVHYLVLGEPAQPLADVYRGLSDADPGPLFLELCRARREEIMDILTTRHIQTNDCGRSAVIGPAITWLAAAIDAPFALVDVGASAGLNLLCDRYRIDYGSHGTTGPADSPVAIDCRVAAGQPPIATHLPPFVARVGIDRAPIDLTDPDDARWLLACVWPDTGRLERTAASIQLARQDLPRVVAGDANATLPGVLSALPSDVVVIVVTTWAFAYFSTQDRQEFLELLDRASHRRVIAWLSAEGAGTVEALTALAPPADDAGQSDLLGAVVFEGGERRAQLLGLVQEHGAWIDWRAGPSATPTAPR